MMRFPQSPETDRTDPDLATRYAYILAQAESTFYRKPSNKELEAVKLTPELRSKYANYFSESSGVIRLLPDIGCEKSLRVIDVRAECLERKLPGSGSSYSFRINNYRISRLSDITYNGEYLKATGVYTLAMFLRLSVDDFLGISMSLPAAGKLAILEVPEKLEDAMKMEKELDSGYRIEDLFLRSSVKAELGTNFLLRSVAYRGKVIRSFDGATYNEMDFDKRRDILLVLRPLEVLVDGSLILAWKKLSETKSPKLEDSKGNHENEVFPRNSDQ